MGLYHWELISSSRAVTVRLGRLLGIHAQPGTVIALIGDLGAGKTCLSEALARGLGVGAEVPVTSPTFSLVNPYDARCPLFHLDLYRLGDEGELETLGFRDLFRPDSVVLVEWADRFLSAFPVDRLEVRLLHRSARTRSVVLDATGPVSGRLLTEVHGAFTSSPSPSGV